MIFVTVGTQGPFERMVKAVDDWCAATPDAPAVFGQIGAPLGDTYRPKHFDWAERLTPDEFNRRFDEAALIVSHAGMGSIISALQGGKQIVVMPRLARLHEHRNEHQLATVRQMASRPGVHVAEDEADLPGVMEQALEKARDRNSPVIDAFAEPSFTDALRAFILKSAP
jgi:UDP-N-acetylglucosamine transferase subunit ALG13